jgi:hypothetical protein
MVTFKDFLLGNVMQRHSIAKPSKEFEVSFNKIMHSNGKTEI